MKMASVSQWVLLVWTPNISPGTDAMKKTTTSLSGLEQLAQRLEPKFIAHLLAVLWKVIAAVQSFFQITRHARQHGQV
jgi:hypothetical protein